MIIDDNKPLLHGTLKAQVRFKGAFGDEGEEVHETIHRLGEEASFRVN